MDPLEYLAQCNDCYISDLRLRGLDYTPLLNQPAGAFSVGAWNALLQYMFPSAPQFQTQEEAKSWLETRLRKKLCPGDTEKKENRL